jgi:hypothetical protein
MQTDPSLSGSLRLHQISDARALEGSEDIRDCVLSELFSAGDNCLEYAQLPTQQVL